jgi:hypothetical protein
MIEMFASQYLLLAAMGVATIFVGTYLWLKPKKP